MQYIDKTRQNKTKMETGRLVANHGNYEGRPFRFSLPRADYYHGISAER